MGNYFGDDTIGEISSPSSKFIYVASSIPNIEPQGFSFIRFIDCKSQVLASLVHNFNLIPNTVFRAIVIHKLHTKHTHTCGICSCLAFNLILSGPHHDGYKNKTWQIFQLIIDIGTGGEES